MIYDTIERKQVSNECVICNKQVTNGLHTALTLSNGSKYHENCFTQMQSEPVELKFKISELEREQYKLRHELNSLNSFTNKLKSFFTKPSDEINIIENKINKLSIEISEKYNLLEVLEKNLKEKLTEIYDFYTTYPPDWDERRKLVSNRDGSYCSECGSYNTLHLHHKIPLSKGGSNQLSNLVFLCEICHSKEHGDKTFSEDFSNKETVFPERIRIIDNAIKTNKEIEFMYRKPRDSSYEKRRVKPYTLLNVDHIKDDDTTLCVKGFCYLRNEERTFALKRMKGLKTIK